jgi:YbbR domain-containing protein
MSVLRGLLFDNLGLKLVALLMAVLVYLNVYTDRPANMTVSFPIQLTDIADSLSLLGAVPSAVQAELRGTGKQLIRMRLGEPVLKISLAGVARGRFERAVTIEDLPIEPGDGLQVERVVGPRILELQLDRKVTRRVPVAPRIETTASAGVTFGRAIADPAFMSVTGPEAAVAALDSVVLDRVRVDARHDTARVRVGPEALPDWCNADPATVNVLVPIHRTQP